MADDYDDDHHDNGAAGNCNGDNTGYGLGYGGGTEVGISGWTAAATGGVPSAGWPGLRRSRRRT